MHGLTAKEHGEDAELDQYRINQQHHHVRVLQAVARLHECHNDPRMVGHEENDPHQNEREKAQRVVLGVMSRIGQCAHVSEPFGHERNELVSPILADRKREASDDHHNHEPHAQVYGPGEAEEARPQLVEFGEWHGHLRKLHLAEEVRARKVEVVHDREHGKVRAVADERSFLHSDLNASLATKVRAVPERAAEPPSTARAVVWAFAHASVGHIAALAAARAWWDRPTVAILLLLIDPALGDRSLILAVREDRWGEDVEEIVFLRSARLVLRVVRFVEQSELLLALLSRPVGALRAKVLIVVGLIFDCRKGDDDPYRLGQIIHPQRLRALLQREL
eukprot:52737-Prymnesium_polylepis.2